MNERLQQNLDCARIDLLEAKNGWHVSPRGHKHPLSSSRRERSVVLLIAYGRPSAWPTASAGGSDHGRTRTSSRWGN